MRKLKIAVYAISKNESKFVDRWYESMKEADAIYCLDTGSTDDTVEKLKSHGVTVKTKIIKPWRFDKARNESLKMVPLDYDVCVCTDLDEVLNKGWREEIENSWDNINRLKYKYNWSHDKFGNPDITFIYEKIHDRKHYKWIYPVHEVLSCSLKKEKVNTNMNIVLDHYPDIQKSRSSYLSLLELSIKENPNDERNLHYLGREYMYHKMYNESIDTLLKHIKLSTWDLEKSASMRFISRNYKSLNRIEESRYWLQKAIKTTPYTREAYVELAILEYEQGNFTEAIINCIKAKKILTNTLVYINEPFCWNHTIDDILSISYYNLGLKDEALYYIDKALEKDPQNLRLQHNKEIFAH